jgi:3-methyladenine DNA glycosylase/8-oxoguanine DNA glycosylase
MTVTAGRAAAELQRAWSPGRPVHLGATLGVLRRGSGDPTFRYDGRGRSGGGLWLGTRTPEGPATLRLGVRPADGHVVGTAWGPGAAWVLDGLPSLLGDDDEPEGFDAVGLGRRYPVLRDVARANAGWRVPRTRRVLEALAPAVLEQKVTGREAWRAWRSLVRWYGERAPGPAGVLPPDLYVAPDGPTWARIPSWDWHRAGVDLSRSRTLVTAAGRAGRLEALVDRAPTEAATAMRVLPGIGVWTAAEVGQRALGDADAVSVGDYHLAKRVGMALVGEPVDDDAMLELLEPYRGHRYRVVRLVELSGSAPARRGPRFEGRDFRHM